MTDIRVRQPVVAESQTPKPTVTDTPATGTAPAQAPLQQAAPQLRVVLAGLVMVMGLAAMDSNIVNTALPRITSDLGGVAHLSWVVTAFMLTSTITTPLYGKLSDMYGRRRLMVISIAVFLTGSVLCGVAQSMLQLIVFRGLQGVGAGGLMTLSMTIIGDLVPPRERGRYQGLFTSVFAVSSLAGPLIGGALTTALSWRWVFYVNLPLGGLALALIMSALQGASDTQRRRIDYPGAGLLTVATTALLLILSWGLSQSNPWLPTLGLAIVAVAATLMFFRQEGRAAEPILSLALFANRTFAVGAGATTIMAFAMMGALVLLPLHLQLVLGRSPIQAGLIVTPQILGMVLSSVIGGRAVTAVGRVKPFLVAGLLLEGLALWGLGVGAALDAPAWVFSAVVFTLGVGMGIGMPNAVTVVQNAVPREDMGAATGAMAFVRSLGGAVGVALSGGVMTLVLTRALGAGIPTGDMHSLLDLGVKAISAMAPLQRANLLHAYRVALEASFLMSGAIMTGGFALVCTLPNDKLRGREGDIGGPNQQAGSQSNSAALSQNAASC